MATLFKKSLKTKNKIDQIRKAVKIIAVINDVRVSDTEAIILTHFILEGYNKVSREEIIKQKLVKNVNILANTLSSLRSRGLLVKNSFKEELCADLNSLKSSQDKLVLMTLLDNTTTV
jgi:hypothetical protein